MGRRFGILTFPSGGFEDVASEWRWAETIGFHDAWLADALVSLRGLQDYEAWTTLAALARETSRLRIGTLISSIAFRHPVVLAAQALTLDHLSQGRLEVGVGAGEAGPDHAAVGLEPWSPLDRVTRLEEQVRMLDRLLRGERVVGAGAYRTAEAQLIAPAQTPRPPIVVAAQGPRSLRLVAALADAWSTLGGQPMRPADPIAIGSAVARTRDQVEELERACVAQGRDPSSVRRSVLAFRSPIDPLASVDSFDEFVGRYSEVGIGEFVFYWPPPAHIRRREAVPAARRAMVERIARERIIHTR